MCPADRSWIWSICHRLLLSHFRVSYRFRRELWLSHSKTFHRHYQMALIYSRSRMIMVTVPDMILPHQSLNFWQKLFAGLCWNSLPLHGMQKRSTYDYEEKRDVSQDGEPLYLLVIYRCHFLTYEAISGVPSIAYTQYISSPYHPDAESSKYVSPSLPFDHACWCNMHTFCTPSYQSDHQPLALKLISLWWDHAYFDSRGWSYNPFNHKDRA